VLLYRAAAAAGSTTRGEGDPQSASATTPRLISLFVEGSTGCVAAGVATAAAVVV